MICFGGGGQKQQSHRRLFVGSAQRRQDGLVENKRCPCSYESYICIRVRCGPKQSVRGDDVNTAVVGFNDHVHSLVLCSPRVTVEVTRRSATVVVWIGSFLSTCTCHGVCMRGEAAELGVQKSKGGPAKGRGCECLRGVEALLCDHGTELWHDECLSSAVLLISAGQQL